MSYTKISRGTTQLKKQQVRSDTEAMQRETVQKLCIQNAQIIKAVKQNLELNTLMLLMLYIQKHLDSSISTQIQTKMKTILINSNQPQELLKIYIIFIWSQQNNQCIFIYCVDCCC
ncbi:Hypothetical_protein [Hexamita inflata]|uniref:Hypothetical_protein n=1 Tax=Hexamita inflata TaxID=28002 RepID=A0ABP1HM19_9EUKA